MDRGEFDGIVAMYHDEGHIAMKLRCGPRCVNITVGLPIVRTSVAHGTAYDIAGKGVADAGSLVTATEVAAKLATKRSHGGITNERAIGDLCRVARRGHGCLATSLGGEGRARALSFARFGS
jgi:Pyridoxal phosphate biosynthetic protein PdxA